MRNNKLALTALAAAALLGCLNYYFFGSFYIKASFF